MVVDILNIKGVYPVIGLILFFNVVSLHAEFTYKIKQTLQTQDAEVSFGQISDAFVELDQFAPGIKKFINDITIKNAHETQKNFFEGTIIYQGNTVGQVEILFEEYKHARERGAIGVGEEAISVTFQFLKNWRVEKVIPDLGVLTKNIQTYSPALVLSTFRYRDTRRGGVLITRGLSMVSGLKLSGPFAVMNKLIGKMSVLPGVTYKGNENVRLLITLKPSIKTSYVMGLIPLYIKADFKELYDKGKIKQWPKPIKSIAIDGYEVGLTSAGETFYRTNIDLDMTTLPKPIRIRGLSTLSPTRFSIAGQTDNLDLGPEWLKFSKAGIGIAVDYALVALTAAVGIPFTGLGLRGRMALGSGEYRIDVAGLGYAEVRSDGFSPIVLEGKLENLQLSKLVGLFGQMAYKQFTYDFPETTLKNVDIYVAPENVTIFDREYRRGIFISADTTIFGKKVDMDILLKSGKIPKMVGSGHVEDIKTPVISLTNAAVEINLGLLLIPRFLISGKLEIPPLIFSQEVDIELRKTGGYVKVGGSILGLKGEVSLLIDVLRLTEFEATLTLMPDQFTPSLVNSFNEAKKGMLNKIDWLKNELNKGINLVIRGV